MREMKVRRCGCIAYQYGPPHTCPKHQRQEEKGLRKHIREQVNALGHDLSEFSEYESCPGKWTAWCRKCERIVILYDLPPTHGDQIAGRPIAEECDG